MNSFFSFQLHLQHIKDVTFVSRKRGIFLTSMENKSCCCEKAGLNVSCLGAEHCENAYVL